MYTRSTLAPASAPITVKIKMVSEAVQGFVTVGPQEERKASHSQASTKCLQTRDAGKWVVLALEGRLAWKNGGIPPADTQRQTWSGSRQEI